MLAPCEPCDLVAAYTFPEADVANAVAGLPDGTAILVGRQGIHGWMAHVSLDGELLWQLTDPPPESLELELVDVTPFQGGVAAIGHRITGPLPEDSNTWVTFAASDGGDTWSIEFELEVPAQGVSINSHQDHFSILSNIAGPQENRVQ